MARVGEFAARASALLAWLLAMPAGVAIAVGLRAGGHRIAVARVAHRGRGGRDIRVYRIEGAPAAMGSRVLQVWIALLDIAAGRLAFVGPRPRALDEPVDPRVAAVRPGLVSLWMVRSRAIIDYGTEDETDLEYLASRSFRGDLALLLRGALAALYGPRSPSVPAATQFFGIRHLNLAQSEVIDLFAIALRTRRRARIAFVNPDCVNLAQRDPIYRAVLKRFDWVLTDGIGMRIAGRMLRQPVRQNVNGTDLFRPLCALLEETGDSLYLLGGRPGVAAGVAQWARVHHPRLRIAGHQHGYFPAEEQPNVIRRIRDSGAAVLLVALGAPRQERWIAAHGGACGATLTLAVGGLFDFYSGRIPRAPQWLRELGGEWIYRLLREPRRLWRRYLIGNAVFLLRVLRERVIAQGSLK